MVKLSGAICSASERMLCRVFFSIGQLTLALPTALKYVPQIRLIAALVFRHKYRILGSFLRSHNSFIQEKSDRPCKRSSPRGQGSPERSQVYLDKEDLELEGLTQPQTIN